MKTELELTVHFEVGEYGGIFAWLESVEHRDLQILPYLSESDKAHLVDAHLANQAEVVRARIEREELRGDHLHDLAKEIQQEEIAQRAAQRGHK